MRKIDQGCGNRGVLLRIIDACQGGQLRFGIDMGPLPDIGKKRPIEIAVANLPGEVADGGVVAASDRHDAVEQVTKILTDQGRQ